MNTSCGASLDKQSALGFAIGNALGRELLTSEARSIGKAAASLVTAAKKKDDVDTLKGNAAAKRTRARKAATVAGLIAYGMRAAHAGERLKLRKWRPCEPLSYESDLP